MERVCIFIDSGNFYSLVLKKLGVQSVDFNFEKFVKYLAGERIIIKDGKRFYTGTVRNGRESKNAISNQNTLFDNLINAGNWSIKTSKLRTRKEKIIIDERVDDYQNLLNKGIKEIFYTRQREKGIDVKIATDIIVGAVDNQYDIAILISSDTDLVPAIDWVRYGYKKKVEYVGFSLPETKNYESTRPIKSIMFKTDIQRVLVESDIRNFITNRLRRK